MPLYHVTYLLSAGFLFETYKFFICNPLSHQALYSNRHNHHFHLLNCSHYTSHIDSAPGHFSSSIDQSQPFGFFTSFKPLY